MNSPLLLAKGIHKTFPMGHVDLHVLRGCDLRVQPGEFVAIMGKSGSGKSTLLHILGALDVPQAGEVYFEDEPQCRPNRPVSGTAAPVDHVLRVLQRIVIWILIASLAVGVLVFILAPLALMCIRALPADVLSSGWKDALVRNHLVVAFACLVAMLGFLVLLVVLLLMRLALSDLVEHRRTDLRRHEYGFVFQSYHLLPELSVLENVLITSMVGMSAFDWLSRRHAARDAAIAILNRVGLGERLTHKPNELSGGERQRVAIARALIHKPKILYADEPTGNLDAEAGGELMKLLKGLHREGQTIVLVTHDAGVAGQADRILRLENGQLRQI